MHETQPSGHLLLEWRWLVFVFKSLSDIGHYASDCIIALLEVRTQKCHHPMTKDLKSSRVSLGSGAFGNLSSFLFQLLRPLTCSLLEVPLFYATLAAV